MDEMPLDYWARKSSEFSILSQVARKYLTIPATLAKIESVFSTAGKGSNDYIFPALVIEQ